MPAIAVVLGATGLVGSHLTDQLLGSDYYDKIILLTRRETGISNNRIEEVIIALDEISTLDRNWSEADLYCCLGTTMKKAGSKTAFRNVDHDAVLEFAKTGLRNGAVSFALVSAVGASPDSAFFYNRVKGETEENLRALGYRSLVIVRPSMILGDRKENRFVEEIGKVVTKIFSPLMVGRLKRYKGVHASQIAKVMIAETSRQAEGSRIIQSEEILEA